MGVVTIALDAMGGDRAPSEICMGARDAVVPGRLEIVLVGDAPTVRAEYGGELPAGVTLRHAPEQMHAIANSANCQAGARRNVNATVTTNAAVSAIWPIRNGQNIPLT